MRFLGGTSNQAWAASKNVPPYYGQRLDFINTFTMIIVYYYFYYFCTFQLNSCLVHQK